MADPRPRSGFATTVGLGLASAALASVASAKPWFTAAIDAGLTPGVRDPDRSADMPLALALSLVLLAAWGVVLVSRGRARRAVVAMALAFAAGVAGCVVAAPFVLPDQIRENLLAGSADTNVTPTGWYVTTAVAAVVAVVVLAHAWRRAPSWPTMSSRYDAPASRPAGADDTDLWKALDAGQDPTDPNRRTGPPSP